MSIRVSEPTSLDPGTEAGSEAQSPARGIPIPIPTIGRADVNPNMIDDFAYLKIEGNLNGEYLGADRDEERLGDLRLRPVSHWMAMSKLEEVDSSDVRATPTPMTRHQQDGPLISDQGTLFFEHDRTVECEEGTLWRIFKGKLSYKSFPDDLTEYQETPVVLKITWPWQDFYEAGPYDDMYARGNHTPQTAWTAALNEDITLRRLSQLQGDIIPNYYGLYTWSAAWRPTEFKTGPPDAVVMIMEDAGEQVLLEYGCCKLGPGEARKILETYEKLHTIGQTVQGEDEPDRLPIIRRTKARTNDNGDDQDQSSPFALIDFQKAQSLDGVSGKGLSDMLAMEDGVLFDMMGYPSKRREDNLLYDGEGHSISGYMGIKQR